MGGLSLLYTSVYLIYSFFFIYVFCYMVTKISEENLSLSSGGWRQHVPLKRF
jgi:hypothetical protein